MNPRRVTRPQRRQARIGRIATPGRPKGRDRLRQHPGLQGRKTVDAPLLQPGKPAGPQGPLGGSPGAPGTPDGTGGPVDLFNAALERMRASATSGYEQNRLAYEEGVGALRSRFFDPANPHSEASQIALADQVARKKSLNAAATSGQLFDGSMVNAENIITDQTQRQQADLQARFDQMAADLATERQDRDADIRSRLEDAEFDYAGAVAGDPEITDVPPAGSPGKKGKKAKPKGKPKGGKKPAKPKPGQRRAVVKRQTPKKRKDRLR